MSLGLYNGPETKIGPVRASPRAMLEKWDFSNFFDPTAMLSYMLK